MRAALARAPFAYASFSSFLCCLGRRIITNSAAITHWAEEGSGKGGGAVCTCQKPRYIFTFVNIRERERTRGKSEHNLQGADILFLSLDCFPFANCQITDVRRERERASIRGGGFCKHVIAKPEFFLLLPSCSLYAHRDLGGRLRRGLSCSSEKYRST